MIKTCETRLREENSRLLLSHSASTSTSPTSGPTSSAPIVPLDHLPQPPPRSLPGLISINEFSFDASTSGSLLQMQMQVSDQFAHAGSGATSDRTINESSVPLYPRYSLPALHPLPVSFSQNGALFDNSSTSHLTTIPPITLTSDSYTLEVPSTSSAPAPSFVDDFMTGLPLFSPPILDMSSRSASSHASSHLSHNHRSGTNIGGGSQGGNGTGFYFPLQDNNDSVSYSFSPLSIDLPSPSPSAASPPPASYNDDVMQPFGNGSLSGSFAEASMTMSMMEGYSPMPMMMDDALLGYRDLSVTPSPSADLMDSHAKAAAQRSGSDSSSLSPAESTVNLVVAGTVDQKTGSNRNDRDMGAGVETNGCPPGYDVDIDGLCSE